MIWPDFSFNGIKNRIQFPGQIGLPATIRLKKTWGHCQAKTTIEALDLDAIRGIFSGGNGIYPDLPYIGKSAP